MNIAPFTFREFTSDTAALAEKPVKPFLPGGRFRGEAPPPPPAPSFTEEQIKAAERDAYKKGFLEGTEEGRKQAESEQADVACKLAEATEHFARCLAPLFADYRRMADEVRQGVPAVALAVARKVAGAALKDNVQASVEDIVTRCVQSVVGEPVLTVTVHESLAAALETRLATLMKESQASMDITVLRDAAMAITDCRVEWKNGEFLRDTSRLWQEIERCIDGLSVSAAHDARTQAEALKSGLPEEVQKQVDELPPPAEANTEAAPAAEASVPETNNNPTPTTTTEDSKTEDPKKE